MADRTWASQCESEEEMDMNDYWEHNASSPQPAYDEFVAHSQYHQSFKKRECSQDIPYPYPPKKPCQLSSQPIPCGASQLYVNPYLLQYYTQIPTQTPYTMSQDYTDLEKYGSSSPSASSSPKSYRVASVSNNSPMTSYLDVEVASSPESANPKMRFLERSHFAKDVTALNQTVEIETPVLQVSQETIVNSQSWELVYFPYRVSENYIAQDEYDNDDEDENGITEEEPIIEVTPEMIAESQNATLVHFPPIEAEEEWDDGDESSYLPVTEVPLWEREYDPSQSLELDLRKTCLIPNLSWYSIW